MSRQDRGSDRRQRDEWRKELEDGLQEFFARKIHCDHSHKGAKPTKQSKVEVQKPTAAERRERAESRVILPSQFLFFTPLRDGRVLYCPECNKARPLDFYDSPAEDPDLIICPECATIGYTFVISEKPMKPPDAEDGVDEPKTES